jgi:pheromone a factor receptor
VSEHPVFEKLLRILLTHPNTSDIVVQGQRYSILEQVGCTTYVVNTPLLYILILIWPVLLGLGSTVLSREYIPFLTQLFSFTLSHPATCEAAFILRALKTRRKELNSYLNTNANANKDDNQSLSISSHPGTRFTRLTLLSLVDTILTVPLSIFVIVANTLMSPVRPYPGWSATHADFGFIPQIPADVWRNPLDENGIDPASATMRRMNLAGAYFSAFVYAFCAVVVFAFFGWSEEVRSGYVGLWWKIAGWFGMERKKQRSKRKEEATIAFATAPGGRDAASR